MWVRQQNSSIKRLIDLIFLTAAGFVMLFIVSFLLINPVTESEINIQAEFVITVTWNSISKDDVDVWLEDPQGRVLFFKQKEVGLMHLDRDDLGTLNDTITLPNGEVIELKVNQEIVTIRGFIPGEWTLNVHMYNKRDSTGKTVLAGDPTTVEVKVDKLNPNVRTVIYKNVTLVKKWQEETVARFTMAADGEVLNIDYLPKSLVKSKTMSGGTGL